MNNREVNSVRGLLSRLWPGTLTGQMILLVVLALVLAMFVNAWVLSRAHERMLMVANEHFLARQYATMVILLENTPAPLHDKVLKAWRRPGMFYGFSPVAEIDPGTEPQELRLQRELLEKLGEGYSGGVRVNMRLAAEDGRKDAWPERPKWVDKERWHRWRKRYQAVDHLVLNVRLSDGRWFVGRLTATGPPLPTRLQSISVLVVAGILVLLVVAWQLRRITRPLRDLQSAASDLGRGRDVPPIELRGPRDVQDTVAAFNTMNQRVNRFVSERTRMLAALSHDLRTPLTTMRLRLELMPRSEERDKLIASLEEMQQMAEATLEFVRQSGDGEALQSVDINALLASICEDFADLGADAEFAEGEPQTLVCRPLSIKRALRNLIENAVNYGERARVQCLRRGGELHIRIQDSGPGISESEMDKVFDPFYRLESSRSRETGGVGLGLSIARQVIHAHGGRITLRNCSPGLEVTVVLPLQ